MQAVPLPLWMSAPSSSGHYPREKGHSVMHSRGNGARRTRLLPHAAPAAVPPVTAAPAAAGKPEDAAKERQEFEEWRAWQEWKRKNQK